MNHDVPHTSRPALRMAAVAVGVLAALTIALPTAPARAAEPAQPGDLAGSTPFIAKAAPLVPLPAKAWQISYETTTATDQPIRTTGTVLVPRTAWKGPGSRPLVGFAPGSQGLADRCAASKQFAAGIEYESAAVAQLLARGWAVSVPDYQGIGTPGEHPYVVGKALGRNVLDSMRAARHLTAAGLDPQGPAALFGYSEGGEAASWAAQLQPTYAPDIPLEGAAVGAAPTDFADQVQALDGGRFSFLIFYSASGFDTAYPELKLDGYLNDRGRNVVKQLRNTCIADAILAGQLLNSDYRTYVKSDPFQVPAWRARLSENDLGAIRPETPLLVGGARQDEVIPFEQNLELRDRWCSLGADVSFKEQKIGEHLTGGIVFAPGATKFLADRFAGVPTVPEDACTSQRR